MELSQLRRNPLPILIGAAAVVILISGMRSASGILNPMLMAGFLALLFQPITRKLRRWGLAGGLAVTLVVLAVVVSGVLLVAFVGVSLRQIAVEFPRYRTELEGVLASLSGMAAEYGIDAGAYLERAVKGPEVARTLLNASTGVAGGLSSLVLTFFIFAFMLGGMWQLERRARTGARDHSPAAAQFLAFSKTIRGYMAVRAVLGLIAAVLNYALLMILGVDYALLWAVLSFVLSFVPNIGFTLSLIPPTLLALVGGGWRDALIVFVGYQLINNVLDNVIGPRFVGRQMQISALLSFLSVIFWAWVLGPTGAILAVPLTVLIRDLAFGEPGADLAPQQPVTSSAVPTPHAPEETGNRE
ncbi:AI-2E family transporter [Longimicrobium terrae]|uniref:Putative PurR-regulated permease PerM n=1 Tax=Longimicrobium terrae TaxID=1639882 RepID=A0A841GMP6_9BACT|nr:AI-2E family transporter [Longimicrobium terrae]MBB4635503.1 putative PurR-regulated permease PerM [Longimicrobium terrae]MBB6069897.1 putative PurR-regulated permease PerM [Longimicrobium terrae]NNC32810.1 AI-2E family transporter [Longimicrobium terrae]